MYRSTRPGPSAPLVALDLDGTLGDYHRHFERFAQMWTGREIVWDPEIVGPFYRQLGMSRAVYRQCKLAYRMGGMKRSIPVFDGAADMVRAIRGAGVGVAACTTRPYLAMSTIDLDTQHWLKRNGIKVDHILYGEHKYRDLVKSVGRDRVVCALDDDLSQLSVAEKLGITPILRRNEANKGYEQELGRWCVSELQQAQEVILHLIEQHKKKD
ncbi:phosphatase [Streptomyces phage Lizz]|nr:phosphatase [Streptomyces phage ShakeNBake]QYW07601.1 phosphatase [Streptomyces phage Lizz]